MAIRATLGFQVIPAFPGIVRSLAIQGFRVILDRVFQGIRGMGVLDIPAMADQGIAAMVVPVIVDIAVPGYLDILGIQA